MDKKRARNIVLIIILGAMIIIAAPFIIYVATWAIVGGLVVYAVYELLS